MKPTMGPAAAAAPTYKRVVIERFLCAHHKVTHLSQMTPFGRRVGCWEVMVPVTLTVETKIPKGTQINLASVPESQHVPVRLSDTVNCRRLDSHLPPASMAFKHPATQKPMDVDLDHVYPFSVVTRKVCSNVPIPVAVRLNFYHQSLNVLEKQEEHDELLAIGGAIKGAYMSVSATPPYGEDLEVAGLKRRQFSYCNEFFTATMALVNEDNLLNGIIQIPHEVCKEAALRLFEGAPEPPEDWVLASALEGMDISTEEETPELKSARFKAHWMDQAEKQGLFPISHYFAVPINHVLAWGLQSKEYALLHKVEREEFLFTPPPPPKGEKKGPFGGGDILLYYLVSNVSFNAICENFKKMWLNKVDHRPLESIGFDMIPMTGARQYPGLAPDTKQVTVDAFTIRSTVSYFVAPKLSREQVANLAPTLSPTFPSCREWDPKEAARQRDLDHYIK